MGQVAAAVVLRTATLFFVTALCELAGCYLVYVWARGQVRGWVLAPAALALAAFAGLLTLHPTASGRVYAAYGAAYVACAVLWLWVVDGERPTTWDLFGAAVTLVGMAMIALGPSR